MYKYDQYDQQIVDTRVEEFRDQVPHGALGLHWVRGRVEADDAAPKVASIEPARTNPCSALGQRGIRNV